MRRLLSPSLTFTGASLATEFAQHLNARGLSSLLGPHGPSPLLPPTAAVAAILDALQMNCYPDTDAGVRTAFAFSVPAASLTAGVGGAPRVQPWAGRAESWDYPDLRRALLSPPLDALVDCERWAPLTLEFPSRRFGNKAIQARGALLTAAAAVTALLTMPLYACRQVVEVMSREQGDSGVGSSSSKWGGGSSRQRLRSHFFTFCLVRQEAGPLKDCWLVDGVRQGHYGM